MYLGLALLLIFVLSQIIAPLYINDLEMFWLFKKTNKRRK